MPPTSIKDTIIPSMEELKQRYQYAIILLKQLVRTDFRLRYQGSFLGYLWSLLRPLLLFIILYIVFAKFLRVGDQIPNYPVYLLMGIVIWNYFVEVTSGSISSIVGRGDLLRKLNFPKYVIVLAGSFSALINLSINFIVIIAFMAVTSVDISRYVIFAPLILAELFIFSLALAFFLSALFVRFRDINYIWEVLLQGAFYATPILYPLTLIPHNAAKLLLLNPVAQMIQDFRYMLVTPQTQTIDQVYGTQWIRFFPFVITLLFALFASRYFRKHSKNFAEEV